MPITIEVPDTGAERRPTRGHIGIVVYAGWRGTSRRRTCAVFSVVRSTVGYTSRLLSRDAPGVTTMPTLADSMRSWHVVQVTLTT